MSQEIDDLLEINSNNHQDVKLKLNTTEHFLLRFLTPIIIFIIWFLINKFGDQTMDGKFGTAVLFVIITAIWLIIAIVETIRFFSSNQSQLAIVNLKVFGLLFIMVIITLQIMLLYNE